MKKIDITKDLEVVCGRIPKGGEYQRALMKADPQIAPNFIEIAAGVVNNNDALMKAIQAQGRRKGTKLKQELLHTIGVNYLTGLIMGLKLAEEGYIIIDGIEGPEVIKEGEIHE